MKIPISLLRVITLCYIAFPLIPFYLGWMKPIFGIPCLLLLFTGIFIFSRAQDFSHKEYFSGKNLLVFTLFISIWLLFSGAGGFGYQFYDHIKNNTLAKELSDHTWPLSYEVEGKKMYLSHYLSFYIVGPFLAGWKGYKYVQFVVFLWTALGTLLGMFWLLRATKHPKWSFAPILILFGGITTLSFLIKYGSESIAALWQKITNHGYVFWMNSFELIPLNYLSFTDMLYWTPQHFIPALLGIAILLNDHFIDKNIKYTPFVISLLAMWSPLILVGIFPIFLFVLFQNKFKGFWNLTNLGIAPILFGVTAVFLLAIQSESLVKHFIFGNVYEGNLNIATQVKVYLYFIFFEVIIWAIPMYLVLKTKLEKSLKQLFILTAILLSLIPLYRFGLWNDWCNRVSMPALVLFAFFAYLAIINATKWKKALLMLLLVLGTHGASIGIVGSFMASGYKPNFMPPLEHNVQTLPEICVGYPITQFVAHEDAFFFKYMAKK